MRTTGTLGPRAGADVRVPAGDADAHGYVIMPVRLTPEIREATWRSQYQRVNKHRDLDMPEDVIAECVRRKMEDPEQEAQDRIAYAAMLAAGRLTASAPPARAATGAVKVKAWPFVETPDEFTCRLLATLDEAGDMLTAVRHVLIESPPKIRPSALVSAVCETCCGHGLIGGWLTRWLRQ